LIEAVQQGLPVIVTLNPWTMPQERWNTEWVRAHGLGVVHRSFSNVRSAVDELVRELPEFQARVRRVENRAVFEVPQILGRILDCDRAPIRVDCPASPLALAPSSA
jgi:1,2-diacylglycerol 3-beta-galactosyltransferase